MQEEAEETGSVKASKVRARAHRDKLAQMALERRRYKEQLLQQQQQLHAQMLQAGDTLNPEP